MADDDFADFGAERFVGLAKRLNLLFGIHAQSVRQDYRKNGQCPSPNDGEWFYEFLACFGRFSAYFMVCNGFLKNLLQQSGCSSIFRVPFPLWGFGDDRLRSNADD
jgi:hypothetical protein